MKWLLFLGLMLTKLGICLGALPYMPREDTSPLLTEAYIYEDTLEYTFFSQTVSWEEALVICQYYHSNLVAVDDVNKAVFLANAIANSNIRFEDIWIGGRAKNGNWLWYSRNEVINAVPDEDGYPPWVRTPNRSSKECLSMDRRGHNSPLFLDVDCRLKKPFICEKGVTVKSDKPLPSKWVRINDRMFILYHGRLSWRDALSFCWQQGLRLAVVSSNHTASLLAEAMIHTRPDFENVWIGATSQFGKWTWVGTGVALPLKPDSSGYPPWKEKKAIRSRTKKCIVLDRHLCPDATFTETSCDRTRDFVCEEFKEEAKDIQKEDEINFHFAGRNMTIILNEVTWWEAERTCESRGSRLAVLDSKEKIDAILEAMTALSQELKHLWVGGRLMENQWKWTAIDQKIPESNSEGFPPWCETDVILRTECLNFDKRQHTIPLMYGLPCYVKQPFACEVDCTSASHVDKGRWQCESSKPASDNVCTMSCNKGLTRMGSRVMKCAPQLGWTGEDTTRMVPQCQRMSDVTFSLLKVISHYETSIGFLFVLDSAEKDPEFTAGALQLVNAIVSSFPLTSSRRAGLISCNSQSNAVVFPYAEQDSCTLRHKLQTLHLKHSKSISFQKTVEIISSQTKTSQGGARTIIFFLSTVNHHTSQNAALLAPLKKKGHAVFTLDVGVDKSPDSPPLATVGPLLRLNHFNFDHALNLTEAALYMSGNSFENPGYNCKLPPLIPGVRIQNMNLPRWLLFRVTNMSLKELNALKSRKNG